MMVMERGRRGQTPPLWPGVSGTLLKAGDRDLKNNHAYSSFDGIVIRQLAWPSLCTIVRLHRL
jgi:hypothetical protein